MPDEQQKPVKKQRKNPAPVVNTTETLTEAPAVPTGTPPKGPSEDAPAKPTSAPADLGVLAALKEDTAHALTDLRKHFAAQPATIKRDEILCAIDVLVKHLS